MLLTAKVSKQRLQRFKLTLRKRSEPTEVLTLFPEAFAGVQGCTVCSHAV